MTLPTTLSTKTSCAGNTFRLSQVTFIPTEGAVVPKVLSKANIESMAKEFSATYSKGLCYKEDSKYILKKSNTFEFTDEDTGTLIQRISAIYTPIFKPMKSSLSF